MKKGHLVLVLFVVFLLTGCAEDYNRSDIKNYVKENYSLSDFKVSRTYEEVEGEDGNIDRLWTVEDEEHNITFRVLDDYRFLGEAPWPSNDLFDDYEISLFTSLYQKSEKKDNIYFMTDDKESLVEGELLCYYKNKDELTDCYDSIMYYKNELRQSGYELSIRYTVKYDFEFRFIGDTQDESGDTSGFLDDFNENEYEDMIYNYYSTVLFYQLEDALSEMTPADKELVMNHENTHRIFKRNDQGSLEYYDDVIAGSFEISFGGLYKILKQENFNVVGDASHYTVKVNSDVYEFSYDYNDLLYEEYDGDFYGYYYKKNGQKIKMNFHYENYLIAKEINEMFGLNIETSENKSIKQNTFKD